MANEKRLIDGNKLRGLKYEKVGFSEYREGWNDAIDTICTEIFSPTVDAVEVIRCKDCVRHSSNGCPDDRVWCKLLCRYMDADGFCSRGERSDK